MREHLEVGPAPFDEDCVQVNKQGDYLDAMRAECRRYKHLLENKFPIPDDVSAYFVVQSNPHDFGTYLEVAVAFDPNDQRSSLYAYHVEHFLPATWDDDRIYPLGPAEAKLTETAE